MPHHKRLLTAVLIAFSLETLSATWLLKIPGLAPYLSFLYFLSGIAIAILLTNFPAIRMPAARSLKHHTIHYRLIIMVLLGLAMYSWGSYWFEEIPIDIDNADMLPVIKVMGERFVAGHNRQVYDIIPSIWKGIYPIYLPAMWLPYVPALAVGIDMRWITMAGLLFSFGAFIFLYKPDTHRYVGFFTGVLAFLLFWWLFADNSAGIISVAEEGVVIAYYVILVLALVTGNPWLTGIAASLCMLSRYALVGWIPAYMLHLALERKWRDAIIFSSMGVCCFVLLFLWPVGWSTFTRLITLPGNYIEFAGRVWHDSPSVFAKGLGFAGWFGPQRVRLLHDMLIGLTFGAPLLFVLLGDRRRLQELRGSWRFRNMPAIANIPLAALKLSLVVFYSFIDVPYLYLFYTSSFVSLILVTLLIRQQSVAVGGDQG